MTVFIIWDLKTSFLKFEIIIDNNSGQLKLLKGQHIQSIELDDKLIILCDNTLLQFFTEESQNTSKY